MRLTGAQGRPTQVKGGLSFEPTQAGLSRGLRISWPVRFVLQPEGVWGREKARLRGDLSGKIV